VPYWGKHAGGISNKLTIESGIPHLEDIVGKWIVIIKSTLNDGFSVF